MDEIRRSAESISAGPVFRFPIVSVGQQMKALLASHQIRPREPGRDGLLADLHLQEPQINAGYLASKALRKLRVAKHRPLLLDNLGCEV